MKCDIRHLQIISLWILNGIFLPVPFLCHFLGIYPRSKRHFWNGYCLFVFFQRFPYNWWHSIKFIRKNLTFSVMTNNKCGIRLNIHIGNEYEWFFAICFILLLFVYKQKLHLHHTHKFIECGFLWPIEFRLHKTIYQFTYSSFVRFFIFPFPFPFSYFICSDFMIIFTRLIVLSSNKQEMTMNAFESVRFTVKTITNSNSFIAIYNSFRWNEAHLHLVFFSF